MLYKGLFKIKVKLCIIFLMGVVLYKGIFLNFGE